MERFAIKIDKKLKANLYKICRLCGIDNPDMVPIIVDKEADQNENACFDVEAEMEMQQKINLLIGLSITKDDRMPQTMCCLCVDKINDFYEFREMCYATNAQTRKLLGLKNAKKPAMDIKPKVEIKEESIVPTSTVAPAQNKNGNRKRKSEETVLKEELAENISKKKLRFSSITEAAVKEEILGSTKKKLRFTTFNEELSFPIASSSKKSKNNAIEDTKLKEEPSSSVSLLPSAVSNKKLRFAAHSQKESVTKKSKHKGSKQADQKEADVKEEIKEEVKEELAPVLAHVPSQKVLPVIKLKFGCNICKERFPAKVNLETHTKNSHIPKIERYVCTACNEVLSKSFDIKNHQLWHKLSKTPYICGCCGESILNTYAFSRHLREHAFETPPALLVLDRECPQCHTSYATNYLYNIHICAVRTKRCAGCNRLQRNDAEYLKHSAQCAKVYLNYSKHIMPSVQALEDAVRIKNENDVEAAAEEMARISGVSLDMAPVVQLTRLSSPLIMAASQCVSMVALDEVASSSSKKSSKKGVSKKDLKRVDDLLKSTLDALVSIKHEPEVHVDQEIPCAGEHSDIDDHNTAGDHEDGIDDFHFNSSDNESGEPTTEFSTATESGLAQVKVKQEIDEISEESSNKISGCLKLKIKKEHGQLNSSIIEQQKSSDKRAEKRKKKKKHKDKEKDKHKLSKDMQDDQVSQDSNGNNYNSIPNIETTLVRIKDEPKDGTEGEEKSVVSVLQSRPQPEATIMTSIPMMQFQIACVSSGVDFSNASNSTIETHEATQSANQDCDVEDVKPNREELDRMLKISNVSSGIAMEINETNENEVQKMVNDSDYDKGNESVDDENDYRPVSDDNVSEQEDKQSEYPDEEQDDKIENDIENSSKLTGIDNKKSKNVKKLMLQTKSKLMLKLKEKQLTTLTKSRNKACKSTAKPSYTPSLQISAVQSGVSLEPSVPSAIDFAPVFIKPEPQNRGYSDEQPSDIDPPTHPEEEEAVSQQEAKELSQIHSAEEQIYISSIDFNNITIKQEKDIEINDVQITQTSIKSFNKLNGIKRKRFKNETLEQDPNRMRDENIEDEGEDEMDEEGVEETDEEELEEEEVEEEEEEEEDEEEDEEEYEKREYRELEYPPELVEKKVEVEAIDHNENTNKNINETLDANTDSNVKENNKDTAKNIDNNIAFVISSVCSQANSEVSGEQFSKSNDGKMLQEQVQLNRDNISVLSETNALDTDDLNLMQNSEKPDKHVQHFCCKTSLENDNTHLSHLAGYSFNSNISITTASTGTPNITVPETDPNKKIFNENRKLIPDPEITVSGMQPKQENVHPHEISLEPVQPIKLRPDKKVEKVLNINQEPQILGCQMQNLSPHSQCPVRNSVQDHDSQYSHSMHDEILSASNQKSQHIVQGTSQDIKLSQESNTLNVELNLQNMLHSSTGAPIDTEDQLQKNLQDLVESPREKQFNPIVLLENPPNIEVQRKTSKNHVPAFEINSANTIPTFSPDNNPLNNYDADVLSKDNQDKPITIAGVVQQANETDLKAQPSTENCDDESVYDDENNQDVSHVNEFEEEDNNNHELTESNNLEERQNDKNQEVLSHMRPTALALHPYLEDISSNSSSLLSSSSSQTPPPPPLQLATFAADVNEFNIERQPQQRLLNPEETENILNESNDIAGRRSLVLPSVGQSQTQQHAGQLLPPHIPIFNFDNINEIAENNNNANIEREQLQDEQQQ